MGRGKRLRLTLDVQTEGEGDAAVVTFGIPEGRPRVNAPDWHALVDRFDAQLPSIFLHTNSRNRSYLAMVLPRGLGEAKGRVVHLAREFLGAEAVKGKHVHYRDGNPFNLTRGNLVLMDRKAAAAEHIGG